MLFRSQHQCGPIEEPLGHIDAALLATGEAIGYYHDGRYEIVRCNALPPELEAYQRQVERQEARKLARGMPKTSRGVKISPAVARQARANGLL